MIIEDEKSYDRKTPRLGHVSVNYWSKKTGQKIDKIHQGESNSFTTSVDHKELFNTDGAKKLDDVIKKVLAQITHRLKGHYGDN